MPCPPRYNPSPSTCFIFSRVQTSGWRLCRHRPTRDLNLLLLRRPCRISDRLNTFKLLLKEVLNRFGHPTGSSSTTNRTTPFSLQKYHLTLDKFDLFEHRLTHQSLFESHSIHHSRNFGSRGDGRRVSARVAMTESSLQRRRGPPLMEQVMLVRPVMGWTYRRRSWRKNGCLASI